MDAVRIDGVGNPGPLVVIKTALSLESPAQVQCREMAFDVPLGESFAKSRNDFAKAPAFPGDEPGQRPHCIG